MQILITTLLKYMPFIHYATFNIIQYQLPPMIGVVLFKHFCLLCTASQTSIYLVCTARTQIYNKPSFTIFKIQYNTYTEHI
jgi:hypothetical protein